VRAERVLGLAATDPVLGGSISPESSDIYAQVLYSVMEEGARTLSDIVLRRMHLGITASRGLKQAEKIADIAGQMLKWNEDERRHHIAEFIKALNKETACLGRSG
jgi:glycerol-3-phosphate dehydrogenase